MTRVNGPNNTGSIDNNSGDYDKTTQASDKPKGKLTVKPAKGKASPHALSDAAAQGVKTNFNVRRNLTVGEVSPNIQEGLTLIGSQDAANLPDDFLTQHLEDLEAKNPTKAYALLEARYNKPLLNELGV